MIDRQSFLKAVSAGSFGALGVLGAVSACGATNADPVDLTNASDYAKLFELPYCHALMNANLATIKCVDPDHPSEVAEIKYLGHGVEANIVVTGIAASKSQPPLSPTGWARPAVQLLLDVWVLSNKDRTDCCALSTIAFPFQVGTTTSTHAITPSGQPAELVSAISSYIVDKVVVGALVAAANAMGQQYVRSPSAIALIHDQIFPLYDKAIRSTVGDSINKAIRDLKLSFDLAITTGDVMSPFLVFNVTAFDQKNNTVDIQLTSIGFSTVIEALDHTGQAQFASAISVAASGSARISKSGSDLNLNYKVNGGTGLGPIAPKYASAINDALIPKLNSYLHELFPLQLDTILFFLQMLTPPNLRPLPPMPVPEQHFDISPTRRAPSQLL